MKSNNNIALLAVLSLIALWSVLFLNMPQPKKINAPVNYGGGFESTEKDNANGAAMYEFNRIKDPATGKIPQHIRELELEFATTLPKDEDMAGDHRMKSGLLTWTARGPYNIGGRTRALGIDVLNDSILLAGSVSGNMWRSTDQGNNWTAVSTPQQIHDITCIAQDPRPNHTSTWYYGTGEAYGASAYSNGAFPLGNGLFKSTDNGLTWTSISSTAANAPQSFNSDFDLCWNMAVDPTTPDTSSSIYVATTGRIYRSINGGASWTIPLSGGTGSPYYTDIAIGNNGIKYATLSSEGSASVKGIRRSVDGITWTKITPDSFPSSYTRVVIGIDPNNENNVYFFAVTPGAGFPSSMCINYIADTEYYSLWKYTYLSGNGDSAGGQWVDLSANIPYNASEYGNYYAQGGYDMYVKVQPGASNVMFLGGTDIFRSTDAFTTPNNWKQIGGYALGTMAPNFFLYPNHHPDQHQLRFLHNDPHAMVSSADGGVFKTMDNTQEAITWISCNNGYITTQFYTCALDHATPNDEIITGGLQDNGSFFTSNSNVTFPWTWACKGDGGYTYVFDGHPYYYFSIQEGKVYKSMLDGNGNPAFFRRVDPIGGGGYLFIAPFAVDPNNNNILYLADSSHIWRNSDLSAVALTNQYDSISTNWSKIDSINSASDGQITALAISNTPANKLYFGTMNTQLYRVDSANIANPTKVSITSSHFTSGASVSCIAIDPTNANKIIVTFSNYSVRSIFYSMDGGTTWTDISANLEQFPFLGPGGNGPSVRWAKIVPVNGDTAYFVGTSVGLYATSHLNGDSTIWVQQGSNVIGNAIVDMIDARLSDGTVIVATHGNGMFSTTITDINQISGINAIKSLASPLQLRNYPNPPDNYTTISFNLSQRSAAELKLFDIQGKEIATVFKGVKEAGLSNIYCNTTSLANGIYFLHLIAGDISETKKIVIAHN